MSRRRTRRGRAAGLVGASLLAVYLVVALTLPVHSTLVARMSTVAVPAVSSGDLPWPAYGQSAIGAVGYGLLAQHGDQTPMPIASVVKVILAEAVLNVRPIQTGTQGGVLTMTADDLATYKLYKSKGESVVPVRVGEQLTQYQALQALLLPSANNMADALANWAFGSLDAYLSFVNPFVKTLGLQQTHIADASGFDPATTSTAVDLTKLAEIAIADPVVAEVVGQTQAVLPVAGPVPNLNTAVGKNGIVGIKTGNTGSAGGCYMFAARRAVEGGRVITVVGVIMSAPSRGVAIADALPLLTSAFANFHVARVQNDQVVGAIARPSGPQVPVVVDQGFEVVGWGGQAATAEITTTPLTTHIDAGTAVGHLTFRWGKKVYTSPLSTSAGIAEPSPAWRVIHAAGYR
jgi:D-alanyl-D-alanine carboxypeptidase (penicillin-binding protein 5/6)